VLIAWVLLLTGYATKMGLAPMHTWKPDAYGEASGIVGGIARRRYDHNGVCGDPARAASGGCGGRWRRDRENAARSGLFSMLIAALFLLGTPDFKRMLAYSSVEHMGILSVGAALGGAGVWAALFHLWTNSLTKGALFLSAGNMRRAAGASTMAEVSGMARLTPMSARMFVVGMLAVTACPPFGPFFTNC